MGRELDPDLEAARSSIRSCELTAQSVIFLLPPCLAAALGVVIGASVDCFVRAVDGSGIGADATQWERRWADQARRVSEGIAYDEDHIVLNHPSFLTCSSASAGGAGAKPPIWEWDGSFPPRFRLHLRLHNGDVRTFDEVIDSLNSPLPPRRCQPLHAAAAMPNHGPSRPALRLRYG